MTVGSHTQLGFGASMLSPVATRKLSTPDAGKPFVPVSTSVLDRTEVLTPHLPALVFSPGWCFVSIDLQHIEVEMLKMAEEVIEGFSMHIFHSLKQVSLFKIMSSLSWLGIQNDCKNHQKALSNLLKSGFA